MSNGVVALGFVGRVIIGVLELQGSAVDEYFSKPPHVIVPEVVVVPPVSNVWHIHARWFSIGASERCVVFVIHALGDAAFIIHTQALPIQDEPTGSIVIAMDDRRVMDVVVPYSRSIRCASKPARCVGAEIPPFGVHVQP